MSTTEPQAGEWWWVEWRGQIVPARRRENAPGWYVFGGPHETWNVGPIARIPDPPAPEPTEAEKIEARRAQVWRDWNASDVERSPERLVRMIRESDEAAGYVLVPTEGPGFERMVSAAKEACPIILTDRFGKALRAAIEAAKGDAR